jgi:hypothetical protein
MATKPPPKKDEKRAKPKDDKGAKGKPKKAGAGTRDGGRYP